MHLPAAGPNGTELDSGCAPACALSSRKTREEGASGRSYFFPGTASSSCINHLGSLHACPELSDLVSNRICVSSPHCRMPVGTAPALPARQPLDLPRSWAWAWGFLRPRAGVLRAPAHSPAVPFPATAGVPELFPPRLPPVLLRVAIF